MDLYCKSLSYHPVWLYFHIPLDSAYRVNQNTIKSFYFHVMMHMLPNIMCPLRLKIVKIDNTWAMILGHMRICTEDALYFNVQMITPTLKIKIAHW